MKGKSSKKDNLTSQVLIEKFSSPFALVNHAIMVLRHRMEAGSADSSEAFSSSAENVVNVVLRDIATGKGGCDVEGQQEVLPPKEVSLHDKPYYHASQEVIRSPAEAHVVPCADEKVATSQDTPSEE